MIHEINHNKLIPRQPMERIELYNQRRFAGPHDIALIRTTKTVVFTPGKIMPVNIIT